MEMEFRISPCRTGLRVPYRFLLGGNKGTFTAGTALQIGAAPGSIAVGDFNRDGNIDIAVGVPANSTVAIYLGNGDGTFTVSTAPLYTLPQPGGIVVADMNGDGLQDLAVLCQSGYVTVELGNGDGTFTPSSFASAPGGSLVSVVQADFNGDGVADLCLLNNESYLGGVTILLGNGDGSFTAAPTISTTTPSAVVCTLLRATSTTTASQIWLLDRTAPSRCTSETETEHSRKQQMLCRPDTSSRLPWEI